MCSAAKHAARSRVSYRNPKHSSQDMAYHGSGMFPHWSKKNKNKNRWPSWESRFGKYVKEVANES